MGETAHKRLLELAKRSANNRETVIRQLLNAVAMSAFSERIDTPQGSYLWAQSCRILSELKAVEAVDQLIECIYCTAMTESATD